MKQKPRGKPFQKGHPGGPGRPKGSGGYIAQCRAMCEAGAWELVGARIKDLASRNISRANLGLKCFQVVAAYGYGNPSQTVKHSFAKEIVEAFVAQVVAIIRRLVPEFCPHCKTAITLRQDIAKELVSLSERMAAKDNSQEAIKAGG